MAKKRTKVSALGEFGLINRLKRKFTPIKRAALLKGIGDDAAVVKTNPHKALIFTTDMMMENVHFSLKYEDFFSIGWKALAVNISDIASMGGIPTWAVVSIGIPVGISVDNVDNIAWGMSSLAKKYAVDIIGGDTIKADRLVLNVALLGEARPKEILYRTGAHPADSLFVTGTIGEAAAGLYILQGKQGFRSIRQKSKFKESIHHYMQPEPRVKESRMIVERKLANSMIDSSDGLLLSVKFLCEQSGVGAKIFSDKIPLHRQLAISNYQLALQLALEGGEDYELLFTVPPHKKNEALRLFPRGYIGEITRGKKIVTVDRDGCTRVVEGKGYEHFKE